MTNIKTPIHISSPKSESSKDKPNLPFENMIITNSSLQSLSAFYQFGYIKKPIPKFESLKEQDIDQAAHKPEPKIDKMRKSKVPDMTS